MLQQMLALAALTTLLGGTAAQSEIPDAIVVRPAETHDVLVNPGMGITTFQRFDEQVLPRPRVVGRRPDVKASTGDDETPLPGQLSRLLSLVLGRD